MDIRIFVWQRCIGHSTDFKKSYYDAEAIMVDGSTQTLYCEQSDDSLGEWRTTPYFPPVPNPAMLSIEEAKKRSAEMVENYQPRLAIALSSGQVTLDDLLKPRDTD